MIEDLLLIAKTYVSIPFKRESVSKVEFFCTTWNEDLLFQFPSNGKVYPKPTTAERYVTETTEFQFPSNGKAYPKYKLLTFDRGRSSKVSIPFKRESVSKVKERD